MIRREIRQRVELTVAGEDGSRVVDELRLRLVRDLDRRRDRNQPMIVQSHDPVDIEIDIAILVDPDRIDSEVIQAVRDAIESFMDFDRLSLGQDIHASNVLSEAQKVAGVTAAFVRGLQFKDSNKRAEASSQDDPHRISLAIKENEISETEQRTNRSSSFA